MRKIAVVYWSGTGNTQQMADAVANGAKNAGAEPTVFTAAEFSADKMTAFDAIALGCPSMGAEELEETEFAPMFASCEPCLKDKKIGLFGSYGWGDGQWMRDWEERVADAGAAVVGGQGVIAQENPDEDALSKCRELGRRLAGLMP